MASKAGPVEIVVDIIDQFSDELKELDAKLEKLDQKEIDIDIEIDADAEIKEVKAKLKQLKKDINTDLEIDTDGAAQAQAIKSALSKDMRSTLHINTTGDFPGVPPPIGSDPMDSARGASQGTLNRNVPGYFPKGAALGTGGPIDTDDLSPEADFMSRIQSGISRSRAARRPMSNVLRMPTAVGDFFQGGMGAPQMPLSRGGLGIDPSKALVSPRGLQGPDFDFQAFNRRANRSLKNLLQTVNRFRPSIMMVWNALAAMIPVMVSLAASAIGLVGAFAALGTAAAGIVGIGMLGWGENMQQSMQNLQTELRALKSELFDVMQPAARTAQPILQDWLRGAPRQVQQLVDPMERLMAAFSGTLGQAGAGIVDWVDRVLESMIQLEPILSQISLRFGSVAGDFLIDWMENMVMFAYQNQDALIRMSHAVRNLFATLLNLSIVVVRVLNMLSPFADMLSTITGIISNRYVAAAISATIATIAMVSALTSLTAASSAAGSSLVASAVSGISAYISRVWGAIYSTYQWIAALKGLQGALIATGIGAIAVGAGMLAAEAFTGNGGPQAPGSSSSLGGSSGGAGSGTTINIHGDVEKRQMDRLLDEVPGETRDEMTLSQKMEE